MKKRTNILISIPDELFAEAELLANHLELSFSELCERAITQFLTFHHDGFVTTRLNDLFTEESSELNLILQQTQTLSLPQTDEW